MNPLPPVDFPGYVDASMLSAYKACPRKFYYQYLRHLRSNTSSVHLVAGGAYAAGLEVARKSYWLHGNGKDQALADGVIALIKHWGDYEAPEDSTKQLGAMILALAEYFDHYGWKEDHIQPFRPDGGDPAIEFSFAIPLPIDHPVTGDPLLYTGRFDMIGVHTNAIYAVDEKTTTRLGPSWSNQWTLRSQFLGYCWAAQQYDYPVAGAIVRGLSILKNDFGHAEVIVQNPPHKIKAWHEVMLHSVERMVEDWKQMRFLQDFDAACTSYGNCPFSIVCDKHNPEKWIPTNYTVRVWNPMETT